MPEQTLTRESLVEFFGEEEYERLCRHEAGHALIAMLFKRPVEYVKINNSKEKPSVTRMPGCSLDGSAHIAIAGHMSDFLIRKNLSCDLDTVMKELPMELYRSDPDYQSFQAACYYYQLAETSVVEQVYNLMMTCQKSLKAIAAGLSEKTCLTRTDIDAIMGNPS